LVHEQSWYSRNDREEGIANPIEHLLGPVEAKVFAATISASKSGWRSRNRHYSGRAVGRRGGLVA
jgi:hypothetical protein